MSNHEEKRRQQREFLFVFNSQREHGQEKVQTDNTERTTVERQPNVREGQTNAARKKLISELREFGC